MKRSLRVLCALIYIIPVYRTQDSRYDSTIYICRYWKSERSFIQPFDKWKLITYCWSRHCAKECACFTAKITGQEEPGLGSESWILVPGFFCSISHILQKSHKIPASNKIKSTNKHYIKECVLLSFKLPGRINLLCIDKIVFQNLNPFKAKRKSCY